MLDTYHDIESRIIDAILELEKCENLDVAALARQFYIQKINKSMEGAQVKNWSIEDIIKLYSKPKSQFYINILIISIEQSRKRTINSWNRPLISFLRKSIQKAGKPPTVEAH